MKNYLAELLGTFVLTFAVASSFTEGFPVPTPVVAGIALGLGVYTMAGFSGAHFNPAVTTALAIVKKISWKDAALYIVAQIIGAALAAYLVDILDPSEPAATAGANNLTVLVAETLGAFVFIWGVAAAVHGKISQGASGLAIGGSLLLGILIASNGSAGVLNPAVALGIGTFSPAYLVGPIVGGALAVLLYRWMDE